MPIIFWCRCGIQVNVRLRDQGRRMLCPGCETLLRVPLQGGAKPVPPLSRPASRCCEAVLSLVVIATTAVWCLAFIRFGL